MPIFHISCQLYQYCDRMTEIIPRLPFLLLVRYNGGFQQGVHIVPDKLASVLQLCHQQNVKFIHIVMDFFFLYTKTPKGQLCNI